MTVGHVVLDELVFMNAPQPVLVSDPCCRMAFFVVFGYVCVVCVRWLLCGQTEDHTNVTLTLTNIYRNRGQTLLTVCLEGDI